ncbi:MAG: glycerol-3-phosphate ABC transporter permease [Chloroflexus sp.]|jgi:sn-glycerol 3-phosphate transport system permease protein|uniref:Binding-protein-dependent transport systems inner membrane component n=1 Tax=Chloroflexus aurantiacus (strain ATCC 29366 / DSM 635 / J-10-fl) TaxID=324602 RepID=A9WK49_CHLAA|nr:carbohydrate ABC transporter permease [Chloroflexus aurantiacus]ABY34500.1 binding-protein-dependent transport systems inner membrane component [Chloroflexus aurantiacus J-10-fl]RMG47339.1 MAG: carbohydrate ABC transporter permease [Chloroflexota bacterium]GIV87399.1 MAG: glycerol-3-phosphate ABC transporter permease [Chloroflexus sp.]HBW66556.1 carbohydrate ABC transporter permease [Chloroflexus aurantiacus]
MMTTNELEQSFPSTVTRRRSLPLSLLMWRIAGYLALIGAVLIIGLPVYWTVMAAFKETREIYSLPVTWWPANPTLNNFPAAWQAAPFGRYYLNSFITTFFGAALEVTLALFSAYALAYLRFPRKDLVFLLLLAALMIPVEITIVPNYLTIARLGWINTYQGIIIPGAAIAYGTFLLRQSFLAIPHEILEAARVDGAGHLRILFSVVAPIAQPAIVTMALLSVVSKWNEFLWPLIVTNTTDMRTLPIGVFWLRNSEGFANWGVVMAGSLFLIVPVLIAFLFAQRAIVEGMTAGAVKG